MILTRVLVSSLHFPRSFNNNLFLHNIITLPSRYSACAIDDATITIILSPHPHPRATSITASQSQSRSLRGYLYMRPRA